MERLIFGILRYVLIIMFQEHGHQCGTTLYYYYTLITSAHGVEYKGNTVDQSKQNSLQLY